MQANKKISEEYYERKQTGIFSNGGQHLWGIVLAGGEGNRLRDFVKSQFGHSMPKQFCTFTGKRSMVRHTIDRALMLIQKQHLFTIITKHHYKYASEEIGNKLLDTVITQPCKRETSAGILLPMLKINHKDPEAIVTIFPSDHFISDEKYFMDYVLEANLFVKNNPDLIVMIGIKPDRNESEYGWIEPGCTLLYKNKKIIKRVKRFREKPDNETAEVLRANGWLWNTFVLIGRSATFIKLMQTYIPEVFNAFEPIRMNIGTSREKTVVETSFKSIPAINFSRFVLEKVPDHLCVMEIPDIYWSDWGDENRIRNDIEKFNLSLL